MREACDTGGADEDGVGGEGGGDESNYDDLAEDTLKVCSFSVHTVSIIHLIQVKKAKQKKSLFFEEYQPQDVDIGFTDMNLSRPLLKVQSRSYICQYSLYLQGLQLEISFEIVSFNNLLARHNNYVIASLKT